MSSFIPLSPRSPGRSPDSRRVSGLAQPSRPVSEFTLEWALRVGTVAPGSSTSPPGMRKARRSQWRDR